MSRITSAIALCALVFVGWTLVGCDEEGTGPAAAATIDGLWETDYPDTSNNPLSYFDFRDDGSLYMSPTNPPTMQAGTWTDDASTVSITWTIGAAPATIIYNATIATDEALLTPAAGQVSNEAIPLVRVETM